MTASHGQWRPARHLALLNRKLLELAGGATRRLLVQMPPRHGKSTLVSHYFPAWYMATHPGHKLILASYEAEFARTWGWKSRGAFNALAPELAGLRLNPDAASASHWVTTDGGEVQTAGVGGPVTGKGADVLVLEDPVKNAEEAESALQRDRLWDWYRSVAYTRLEASGAIVLVMTRWHQDDLAGRLLRETAAGGEAWDVLRLPALAETGDVLGRAEGEPLWPERFDLAALATIRATVGPYWWAALYQGRPSPPEGGMIKRAWWSRWAEPAPPMSRIIISWDTAFKAARGADWSVAEVWGLAANGYYLLDLWRGQVGFPDLLKAMREMATRWPGGLHVVEEAGSGQSMVQVARRETALPVIGIPVTASKIARVNAVIGQIEAGRCFVPAAPRWWVGDFIEECAAFPQGEHDDIVDAATLALGYLIQLPRRVPLYG